jgi:epsilon-lactone hydrolase
MTDPEPGVLRPRARVPFPRSISDAARAALARHVDPDGGVRNAAHVLPDPLDHDGWRRLQQAASAGYAAAVAQLAGEAQAAVETVTLGDTVVHRATPAQGGDARRAYLDFHGGALVFGGGEACRAGARMLAAQHRLRCYAVDYRTPPDHPYPAAVEDGVAAYRHALAHHRAADIVVGGRSAGGNIAVATLLRARDAGLPMPAGLVLLSPQVDLTETGDSFATNRLVDVVLPGSLMPSHLLYAAGADLADPGLSPLFAALDGLPATLLQSGTRDLFLSNTVRMHRALRRAGVAAELHVFEAMPHGGFGGDTPEDDELRDEVSRFVRSCWRDD